MAWCLLVCVALLAHVFVLYPALLGLAARMARGRKALPCEPGLTVIVCAYNEAANIVEKVRNVLSSRYPLEKLQLVVASDGSADGTDREVLAIHHPQVQLISLPVHEGKTVAVNAAVREARAEILVFSDADTLIAEDAMAKLVRHFADPRIGAVCARRSERPGGGAGVASPAKMYNRYEGVIKRGEGALGRVLGCDGSLYAMRRELFRPLPTDVPDDFVNALRVLDAGRLVCYEPEAVAWEALSNSATAEFQRKRRTVARGIRGLWSVRSLLNPFRNPLVFLMLFSHKILRWSAGILMLAALVFNILLAGVPIFRWLLLAQAAGYAMALLGCIAIPGRLWKVFRAVRFFVFVNLAAAAGIVDVLTGRRWKSWPVERVRT
jgi:cellulose synthase/poly-beta-1,6-N-acetylglucosamine synthase-like glycosyltransferase